MRIDFVEAVILANYWIAIVESMHFLVLDSNLNTSKLFTLDNKPNLNL